MTQISANVLNKALPIVAKALGRSLRVNVTVGGETAYCNGHTINIPLLPAKDTELADMAYGYLDHEAGHLRYSDFDVFNDGTFESPLHQELTNILEDVRIEKAIGQHYPGVRKNLARLVERLAKEGMLLPATPDVHPSRQLQRYINSRCRSEVLGQPAAIPLAEVSEAVIRKTLPRGAKIKLDALISQVPTLDSSRAAAELARRILTMLKEEQEKSSDAPGGESPQQGDNTSPPPGSDSGEGNTSTSPEGNTSPPGNRQPESKAPEDGAGNKDTEKASGAPGGNQAGANSNLGKILAAEAEDLDQDMGDALAERLSQESEEAVRNDADTFGGVAEPDPLELVKQDGRELVASVKRETNALRKQMAGMLDGARDEESWLDTSGTTIDGENLYRVAIGDPRIFLRESRQEAVNTAVQVLVDRSGSMSSRMDTALRAALAVALALEQTPDVSVAIACFPGSDDSRVIPLIPFGQSVRLNAGYFGSVGTDGGTPMTEAVYYGINQLLCQPEDRRILLVITDGGPNNRVSCCTAINAASTYGVEVYGLGIQCEAVEGLFPHSAVINSSGDLARAMFSMLQEALSQAA